MEYVNLTIIAFKVANNSCYNNYLDPYNRGSARACIDSS